MVFAIISSGVTVAVSLVTVNIVLPSFAAVKTTVTTPSGSDKAQFVGAHGVTRCAAKFRSPATGESRRTSPKNKDPLGR